MIPFARERYEGTRTREEGRHEGILSVAKRLLIEEGMSPKAVQKPREILTVFNPFS
ncbi:MAG: hypothetical protein V4471_05880 [Pseudomonadota bacterium]